ncbi:MAG: glycosyltransferase family 2 protein [Planctomycetota bacterium]|jgi:GT2 family glycosyltransferase
MAEPTLSVVVLSWNTKDLTLACLRSLHAGEPRHPTEVLVIDNASTDGSADAIAEQFPQARLARNDTNRGYAAANNQGASLARGRFLCLLNSDTEVPSGALDALVDFLLEHGDYGAVAPRLSNQDGSVQRACMRFPGLLTALCYDTFLGRFWPGSIVERRYEMADFDHLESRDVDQPPGAAFLMNRQEFLDLGGLDETLFLFFNDVDLCQRLWRQGRRIRYLADVDVVHHRGASTKGFDDFVVTWHRNRMAYYRKRYGPLVVPYMRMIVRLRALQEWFALGSRHQNRQHRRDARRDLRTATQQILRKA